MKLDNTFKDEQSESSGSFKEITGTLNNEAYARMVDMVSNQMYSNPIGSLVRELASNCFDAHTKWEKQERERLQDDTFVYDEPVIVKYSKEEGTGFISFIDVGTGLSPEQMVQIYMQLFQSDKNSSDDYIGGFGLGSKSFLSYTDSANVITRVDNIEYNYIISKNDEGGLVATLLNQKETVERNGTEVKIAIGNYGYYEEATDWAKFGQAIKEQLYYFDNIYIEGFGLENEYQLYETDTFKYRTGWDNPYKEMHICLEKVVYPIDWKALELEPINIPVGVKFSIGELKVTINRESLRYQDHIKVLIKERINNVIDNIRTLYNKQAEEVDTLEEYYNIVSKDIKFLKLGETELIIPYKGTYIREEGKTIFEPVISGLVNVKCKPFAHLPVTLPKDPFFMFIFLGRYTQAPSPRKDFELMSMTNDDTNIFKAVTKNNYQIYRIKDRSVTTKTQNGYIWWKDRKLEKYPVFITIRKRIQYEEWCKQLGLGEKVSKVTHIDRWGDKVKRKIHVPILNENVNKFKIIKEFKELIIKELKDRSELYSKQEPTPAYLSYLELIKVKNRRPKLEGHISINNLVTGNASEQFDLSTLEKFKGFIIYGTREQAKEVRAIKDLLINNNKRSWERSKNKKFIYKFFTTGKTNFSKLQNNPYYMCVEEFMSNANRLFRNSVTAWYINRKITDIYSHALYKNLDKFNSKLAKELEELRSWGYKNYSSYNNDDFLKTCYDLGKEKGFLWNDKIEAIDKAIEWFKGLEHLGHLDDKMLKFNEFNKDLVVILKHRKKRLSTEHYLIQIPPVVEPVKEEITYQLVDEVIEQKLLVENPTYIPLVLAENQILAYEMELIENQEEQILEI